MLDETELPPIEPFYDALYELPCSASNYAHVGGVWDDIHEGSVGALREG